MKTGRAALDPSNPQHRHAMSLPGTYYMDGQPTRVAKLSKEEEARLENAREEFRRRKEEGTLPKLFS